MIDMDLITNERDALSILLSVDNPKHQVESLDGNSIAIECSAVFVLVYRKEGRKRTGANRVRSFRWISVY